jgi:predicted AAA+ superfamily ATPase
MIQSDLDRYNEWWLYGKVRQELAPSYKRLPFSSAWNLLNTRQIAILTGLRRIGKTTILYQLISKLLESHDEKNVMYYSFEEKGDKTRDVLEAYEKQVLRRPIQDAGRLFIFLDEVQYSPDWVYTVKRYYDLYPNIKFYLSGSSSLLLGEEALDKLAGRFFFLDVYPLTFKEFMQIKGVDVKEPSSALEPYFSDYLTKAGFPEILTYSPR